MFVLFKLRFDAALIAASVISAGVALSSSQASTVRGGGGRATQSAPGPRVPFDNTPCFPIANGERPQVVDWGRGVRAWLVACRQLSSVSGRVTVTLEEKKNGSWTNVASNFGNVSAPRPTRAALG
jgi:hypothetical protein